MVYWWDYAAWCAMCGYACGPIKSGGNNPQRIKKALPPCRPGLLEKTDLRERNNCLFM